MPCDDARSHFSEEELVKLTLAVVALDGSNRLAVSFRSVHPRHKTG
jgi:alkylhydroperoxidase family enzyme